MTLKLINLLLIFEIQDGLIVDMCSKECVCVCVCVLWVFVFYCVLS